MKKKQGEWEWWPIEAVTTDPCGAYVEVIRDAWWVADDQGRVLMWRNADGSVSPQCNTNEMIMDRYRREMIMKRYKHRQHRLEQIRVALVPIRINDYRY